MKMLSNINKNTFPWIVAMVATLGSLYFSEIKGYEPCTLCWYQRILMYPLTFIFAVAFFKRDYKIFHYTLPLSVLGMLVSAYHYGVQKLGWELSDSCQIGVPCSGMYIDYFGFITIPLLAFTAFALINIYSLSLLLKKR